MAMGSIADLINEDLKKIEILESKEKIERLEVETIINRYNTIILEIGRDTYKAMNAPSPDLNEVCNIIKKILLQYKYNNYKKITTEAEKNKVEEEIKKNEENSSAETIFEGTTHKLRTATTFAAPIQRINTNVSEDSGRRGYNSVEDI
ncbi:MAG: hypothetical protein RR594_05460 [Clostridia bacterium]